MINETFIDKCTARWLYEKKGIQLYEMVLDICPESLREEFRKILAQETAHKEMIERLLNGWNADPYRLTPTAKVVDVETEGFNKVLEKAEFDAALEAILAYELSDAANWELLVMMARRFREPEAVKHFELALHEEIGQLKWIRQLLLERTLVEGAPERRTAA